MTNEVKPMRLIDAPVGLLECNGTIIMKTEYMTQSDDGSEAPECYIVETGEYFCGGVDTLEELRNMEVKQVCFNNFFREKMLESENRILSEMITETETKCKRLDESRERANESAHMWESRCKMLEERAQKAERERDAAIKWIREFTESIDRPCVACKHETGDYVALGVCGGCSKNNSKWEWKGKEE